jgi:hypothetical protein
MLVSVEDERFGGEERVAGKLRASVKSYRKRGKANGGG